MRQRVRALWATPRFTIVSLLTIALLVCGITTIFSVVNGVVLRALPYPDAERLVRIDMLDNRGQAWPPSRSQVERLADASHSFDRWITYRIGYVTTMPDAGGELRRVHEVLIGDGTLQALGFQTHRGRLPNAGDRDPVAVIGYSFWQQMLGGADDVVGRSVKVGTEAITVIGVVRATDELPLSWLALPILYRPVRQIADEDPRLTTLARLRDGQMLSQGRAELQVIAAESPSVARGSKPRLTRLLDAIVGDFARQIWLFFGVAALVVLIGIGNLTSLHLARNTDRRKEVMVRFALGASRRRLVRELVGESLLVGTIGGLAGLLGAVPAIRFVTANLPRAFPRADQIGMDLTVALFAVGTGVGAALVIGAISAWILTETHAAPLTDAAIKGASRPVLQGTLIGAQTAVAMMLLVGTGLLLGSLARLYSRDAGMREDGLWMAIGSLPERYRGDSSLQYWNTVLADVRKLPSIEGAALMVNASGPLSGGDSLEGGIVPEGSGISDPGDRPSISVRRVSSGFFETVHMPIKRGRPLLPSDVEGSERVAVLNELAASALWPGQDPLGRRFVSRNQSITVVGIIADYRHARLDGELAPQIFFPHEQRRGTAAGATVLFRATTGQAVADVLALLSNSEKDLSVRAASMAEARWRLVAVERYRVAMIAAFALTAMALATVGIAGLVGYTVAQRMREIAIRMALGAPASHVVRVTTAQTLLPAALGVVAGAGGAAAGSQLIRSYLVELTPLDSPTYVAALVAMMMAMAVASVVPARRATTIDPAVVLRRD